MTIPAQAAAVPSPPPGRQSLPERAVARFGLVWSPNLGLLAAAAFCMSFGMAAQNAVGNNFQVETLRMTAADRGVMEGAREVPGLFLVAISALTVALPVPRLALLTVATMAVQYLGFYFVGDVWQLIGLVVVGSIGFHLWMPLSRELNLSLGDPARSGRALGFMGGVGSAGGLAGMVMVYLLAPELGYRVVFLVSAVALTGAAILVGRVRSPRPAEHERRRRLVFRREYGLFYLLNFLEGSARQIWGSFAMFTLVKFYGIGVRTVTAMLIANSLLTVYMNPRIGAWIDQWGERKALMVGYSGLVVVFLAFAFTSASWQAIAVYFAYSTMFAFNMATPSYLNKIARPGELSPSLAMGVTAEHLAGVAIPVAGGLLWVAYGYRTAFLIGAAVAGICLLAVTRLPRGRLVPVGHSPA